MRSFALLVAAAAVAAAADSCANGASQCDPEATALLVCDGGAWKTNVCQSDQYCMTMNPAMIHCMLKPDGGAPDTATQSHTDAHSDTNTSKQGHSATSPAGTFSARGALAAVAALGAIGLAALF
ncbi:hypothetical protein IWQ56_001307 [Coemansia nantahalensis]|nr:hypothetical protein IWQ56_001307 [Coemansia nantahalensis]